MMPSIASGLCFSFAMVSLGIVATPATAQLPFETCLMVADSLFRDGSDSELAAIAACQGTTALGDTAACLELADRLWPNDSDSELAGIAACQVRERALLVSDGIAEEDLLGSYAICLRQAKNSTQDGSPSELAAIQACSGSTQPAEVAACLRLAESLWRDETAAEQAALSSCQVGLN